MPRPLRYHLFVDTTRPNADRVSLGSKREAIRELRRRLRARYAREPRRIHGEVRMGEDPATATLLVQLHAAARDGRLVNEEL